MNIYAFADETHPQLKLQIAAMLRNNLQGLEIRTVDGMNISDMSVPQVVEIEKKLADAGYTVSERVQVGATIGCHIGPGVCGFIYVEK